MPREVNMSLAVQKWNILVTLSLAKVLVLIQGRLSHGDLANSYFCQGLEGFFGFNWVYRKVIKNYGQIAAPLTALLRKNAFVWSTKAELAFHQLKVAVSQPPILALPDFNQPFIIECDASRSGLGAVLMQNHRPIAFHSQTLKGKALQLSTY